MFKVGDECLILDPLGEIGGTVVGRHMIIKHIVTIGINKRYIGNIDGNDWTFGARHLLKALAPMQIERHDNIKWQTPSYGPICECGSDKVNSSHHSGWCPKADSRK